MRRKSISENAAAKEWTSPPNSSRASRASGESSEKKLQNVIPLATGYCKIGFNYVTLFRHEAIGRLAKFGMENVDKDTQIIEGYCIVLPYQNKALAKQIAVSALKKHNYPLAAKSVGEKPIFKRKVMEIGGVTSADMSYAKQLDKKYILEVMEAEHANPLGGRATELQDYKTLDPMACNICEELDLGMRWNPEAEEYQKACSTCIYRRSKN